MREAADGPAFLKRVREETGLTVRLLSGEEEARYAALGVIAGQPDAEGVVGDLGGSSLELVRLNGSGPAEGATLPLGPLSLGAPKPLDIERTRRIVDDHLAAQGNRFASADFHAVNEDLPNAASPQSHGMAPGIPIVENACNADDDRVRCPYSKPRTLYAVNGDNMRAER